MPLWMLPGVGLDAYGGTLSHANPSRGRGVTVEWHFYVEDKYAYGDCEAFGSYFNFDDLQVGDFVGQYQEINVVFKQFQRAGWASYLVPDSSGGIRSWCSICVLVVVSSLHEEGNI